MVYAKKRPTLAPSWPLLPVPPERWPPRRGSEYPTAVWLSRLYLAQQYACPPCNGIEVRRLSVNRVTARTVGGRSQWDADIPWEDLMRCKRDTGHDDWYAIEIYPRDRDIVNVANMRHLWLLAEPLPIGWFENG